MSVGTVGSEHARESDRTVGGRSVAAVIGRIGVWTKYLDRVPAVAAREFAELTESLGFGALWIPESTDSKEVFAHAAILLSGTDRIVIATGIANIWARDPIAMANGGRTLAEAYPSRFLLGMGVGHAPSVRDRGHAYMRPLQRMREYCDAMDAAPYAGPAVAVPRVLAALGPGMLRLAAARAAGAHPYFVPPEHTKLARELLGGDPILAVEQACILEPDPAVARKIARAHMGPSLLRENYKRSLRRLGWTDAQMSNGGSDELVDALVAWGDPSRIRERVAAHLKYGADHVALQVWTPDMRVLPRAQLERVAPGLQ